jgi:hypothetical protein
VRVRLDLGRVDAVHRAVAEEGREVAAQVAAVVGDRGALALHHVLQTGDVRLPRLADRPPLAVGDDGGRVDPPAQLALGLGACEPVGVPGVRLSPSLRFTRVPPTHHEPYQLARPPRSTTTSRRPVP